MNQKRLLLLLLLLLCIPCVAMADGASLSADALPACYQYTLEGTGSIYADAAVPVYAQPNTSSAAVDYVYPMQPIHIDAVDRTIGMSYIFYHADRNDPSGNFGKASLKGWVENRYIPFYPDSDSLWVVTTDHPGNRLNLRTAPAASSISLGKYYAGTIVEQLEPARNGYMKVKISHMTGYMDTRYLVRGMYTPSAELPLAYVVGQNNLALRKKPAADSEIIKLAPAGAYITVLGVRSDGWIQVMYENEIGFCLSYYVSESFLF